MHEKIKQILESLVSLSRFYGQNPEFVLAGGGNTSFKNQEALYVKASGVSLSAITADQFVKLSREKLNRILDLPPNPDPLKRESLIKEKLMATRLEPEKGLRPSVEAVLHHLIDYAYVVHTHATLANALTCCVQGKNIAARIIGNKLLWIPYVDPGQILALTVQKHIKNYQLKFGQVPHIIFLENHGLIVSANSPNEIKSLTHGVIQKIASLLTKQKFKKSATLKSNQLFRSALVLMPALRGLLADGNRIPLIHFHTSMEIRNLSLSPHCKDIVLSGPLTPDQIVYCKSQPLFLDTADPQTEKNLSKKILDYRKKQGYSPKIIFLKQGAILCIGDTMTDVLTIRDVYVDAIKIMNHSGFFGKTKFLNQPQRNFIENWEVEHYRRQVAAGKSSQGRLEGKIALVTGGSQGFGEGIVREFVKAGAHVMVADINLQGAQKLADELSQIYGPARVSAVMTDVTDKNSVQMMVDHTVALYGGIDILVSNAGILRSGSVKLLSEEDFELVTKVNYKAFFLCTQFTAPVMAKTHRHEPRYSADIIQINSKSGLAGSNKNAAYAGSKFGGLGLVQSFALELVEDGIKVNAVCPGNFFSGPLWSDPKRGLFVQYLKAGKVPEARTINDVKKFYESKVPMGRGCEMIDVVRALFYIIEQRYETGQAIPVTGGQVMLN